MFFYFLVLLCCAPWLIPAIGFLATLDRRGYPVWIADVLLFFTGFIGLAGFAGQTALRSWMISKTILAPIILWILAALFLRRRPTALAIQKEKSIRWHVLLAVMWGSWLTWNGYMLTSSTSLRSSQERANLGSLGSIRSGLKIYKSDAGQLPSRLEDILPKGLDRVPELHPIALEDRILHPRTSRIEYFAIYQPNDDGGWGYINVPTTSDGRPNPDFGRVFINCRHTDVSGTKNLSDY